MRPACAAAALVAVLTFVSLQPTAASPDGPEKPLQEAAAASQWGRCPELMREVAKGNDKKSWQLLLRVTERAPEGTSLPAALRECAAAMADPKVQDEVKKAALKSSSVAVRRELLGHCGARSDWPTLIEGIQDKDEEAAAIAAWRLVDAKVEAGVEPLIALMEKLEKSRGGIWDVCRNGLGRLLGQRLETALEYRSAWEIAKTQGGLAGVKPVPQGADGAAAGSGGTVARVRIFGRPMECTRVVFVLDVSGSMLAVDPDQTLDPDLVGTQVRGGTQGKPGEPAGGGPAQLNRLDRAKLELERMLQSLPDAVKINIVAYSTYVSIWRDGEGNKAPQLHAMNAGNKRSAIEFVKGFKADGVTVTDDALRRAYDVEGARCFYLLSDGAATHDGTTFLTPAEMVSVVDELGQGRSVTIHTLGFTGADKSMMQAVADKTGGRYTDIR